MGILGDQASMEAIDALRARLGLDRPLIVQYSDFMVGVLSGDWGTSLVSGRPVIAEILLRLRTGGGAQKIIPGQARFRHAAADFARGGQNLGIVLAGKPVKQGDELVAFGEGHRASSPKGLLCTGHGF